MLDAKKATIGANVWYYSNKDGKPINTTVSGIEVMNWRGEPACCVLSEKDPVQLKYLYEGHNMTAQYGEGLQKGIPMYNSAPRIGEIRGDINGAEFSVNGSEFDLSHSIKPGDTLTIRPLPPATIFNIDIPAGATKVVITEQRLAEGFKALVQDERILSSKYYVQIF